MGLPKFELIEPRSLKEACQFLLEKAGETEIMAGGTDILVRMKQRLLTPRYLLDIKAISNMRYIQPDTNGGLKIGALTTLEEIENSLLIREKWLALAYAARRVAAFQHRTRATIGGNICLDARCWYYNQEYIWRLSRPFCFKMGGDCCHVVKRGKSCYALFCADTVPALIALGAKVKIVKGNGERIIDLEELYTHDGKKVTGLAPDELVAEVSLPPLPDRSGAVYLKHSIRSALDFPLVSAAAILTLDQKDETVTDAKLIFSGVTSGPAKAREAVEQLKGHRVSKEAISRTAKAAVKEIKLQANIGCTVGYRRRLMEVYAERALEAAWQQARGG